MRCFGFTRKRARCKNSAHFMFCKSHVWQPIAFITTLVSGLGVLVGLYGGLLKPMQDRWKNNSELKKLVSVEVKANRRENSVWEGGGSWDDDKSDVVTLLLDRQPVKSIEIYHTAKDQRYKDYPMTMRLADSAVSTDVEYQVIDLDGDGISEIIIVLTDKLYGLHFDKQINVLIYSPRGDLLTHTPYPSTISGLNIGDLNPYSAYRSTVVVFDAISQTQFSSTFANDFNIFSRGGERYLEFSWVVDGSSYAGNHLHQVEYFSFREGRLISVAPPAMYISNSWEGASRGGQPVSLNDANAFMKENNLPSTGEMLDELKQKGVGG